MQPHSSSSSSNYDQTTSFTGWTCHKQRAGNHAGKPSNENKIWYIFSTVVYCMMFVYLLLFTRFKNQLPAVSTSGPSNCLRKETVLAERLGMPWSSSNSPWPVPSDRRKARLRMLLASPAHAWKEWKRVVSNSQSNDAKYANSPK